VQYELTEKGKVEKTPEVDEKIRIKTHYTDGRCVAYPATIPIGERQSISRHAKPQPTMTGASVHVLTSFARTVVAFHLA